MLTSSANDSHVSGTLHENLTVEMPVPWYTIDVGIVCKCFLPGAGGGFC